MPLHTGLDVVFPIVKAKRNECSVETRMPCRASMDLAQAAAGTPTRLCQCPGVVHCQFQGHVSFVVHRFGMGFPTFWSLSGWGAQFRFIQPGLPGQSRQIQSCCRDRTWLHLLVDATDWLLSCLPAADQARVWLKAVTLRVGVHRCQSVTGPGYGIDRLRCQIWGSRDRVGDSGAASSPNVNHLQLGSATRPQGWEVDFRITQTVSMQHHRLQDMRYRRTLGRHASCRCSLSAQLLACQCPRVLEL